MTTQVFSTMATKLSGEQQTLTLQQGIQLAMQHHTAGRLPEAETIFSVLSGNSIVRWTWVRSRHYALN